MSYSKIKMINFQVKKLGRCVVYVGLFAVVMFQISCIVIENKFSALPPGYWRGQLKLHQDIPTEATDPDAVIQNVEETVVPIIFEVVYNSQDDFHIVWQNGTERIKSDSIIWGRDPKTGKDTIRIEFPIYDTHISAVYEERVMEGYWEVHYKDNYRIPFVAFHGQKERFKDSGMEPEHDISGNWTTTFQAVDGPQFPAIAEFNQEGRYLTGTFVTETGDYRYLEGVVQADKFMLSCFDGAHAYLFEGKVNDDQKISGSFFSGLNYKAYFEGEKIAENYSKVAFEADGFSSQDPVIFSGKDLAGQRVSTDDEIHIGKAKVIQVLGTWCPNCKDETEFLVSYIDSHPGLDDRLSFIGLAFEAYRNEERSLNALRKYKNTLKVPYPIWLGGYKDKSEATAKIQVLDTLKAFPTLIFLDSENRVVKVHSGFAGPATSQFEEFKKQFDQVIESLLAEKLHHGSRSPG